MNGTEKDLAIYRIEKAKGDLETAKINFDNGKFAQSINRSYYAMFHITRALLSFDRFDSSKHSGIISYFNQYYVKTGKIEMEYSKMLREAEEIRNDSDYDDFFIATKEQAEHQIKNAEKYVERIEGYIKEQKMTS
ncbi:MAG: HEPN domain-containing protein [bacterium]